MRSSSALRRPALLVALALTSACAAPATRAPAAPGPERVSAAEIEAIYRARADSARARFSPADVRFMTDMIHHHAQALEMARMAPAHGASDRIRMLAARIESSQLDEIATMEEWLRERGLPVPDVGSHPTQAGHHAHSEHTSAPHRAMPGMLSAEQMARLHAARGAEFDRLFLISMIEHHRGAVTMVHELFATDGAGLDDLVFQFASDVQVDQTTEIARMELMLAAMPADGHPR
jgi:uncharacterized protein (DUF305 family)